MQHIDERKRLTVDWENVVRDQVAASRRVSTIQQLTYDSLVGHYGQVEFDTELARFCTGSSYEGSANKLGFSGFGQYTYPHGVIFTGFFKNGQFHGEGDLIYPKGHRLQGIWDKGRLIHSKFVFPDGLKYNDPWTYCKFPNRFYHGEHLARGGDSRRQDVKTLDNILLKENEYFTGDGIFDADTKRVRTIDHKILRVVAPEEEAIIKKQYRRGGDHSVGLNRDLYEFWTMGRQSEISDIHSLEDTQSPGFATPEKSIDRDSSSEFTLMKY
nr:unnamed protein product [Callosobruchus chinensis]